VSLWDGGTESDANVTMSQCHYGAVTLDNVQSHYAQTTAYDV